MCVQKAFRPIPALMQAATLFYVRPDNPLRFLIYFRLDAVTVPAIYCLAGFTGLVIGLLLL